MTLITTEDGKIVLRDGKVGTEQACCCDTPDIGACCPCEWVLLAGAEGCCNGETEEQAQATLDSLIESLSSLLPEAEEAGFQEIEIQDETSLSDSGEGFWYLDPPIYIAGLCCGMYEGPFESQPFTAITRSCVPGPNTFVGGQCEDNKTAAECETPNQYHPGLTCGDDPCSNPLP